MNRLPVLVTIVLFAGAVVAAEPEPSLADRFCELITDPAKRADCKDSTCAEDWQRWLWWYLPPAVETKAGVIYRMNAEVMLGMQLCRMGLSVPVQEMDRINDRWQTLVELEAIDEDAARVYRDKLMNGGAFGSQND